jgi:hypothetical protein
MVVVSETLGVDELKRQKCFTVVSAPRAAPAMEPLTTGESSVCDVLL